MDQMHSEHSEWESLKQTDQAHDQSLTDYPQIFPEVLEQEETQQKLTEQNNQAHTQISMDYQQRPSEICEQRGSKKESTEQTFSGAPDFDVTTPPPGTYQFPIVSLSTHEKIGLQKFSRPDVLPPRCVPMHSQILWFVYRWTNWAAIIEDEHRREKVFNWIGDVTQKALDKELECSLGIAKPDSEKKLPKPRKQKPSQEVMIVAHGYNPPTQFAVRQAELKAHDIIIEDLKEKVKAQELHYGEKLLEKAARYYHGPVQVNHWYHVYQTSPANPYGRDLFAYALFEVQRSCKELKTLERLLARFVMNNQKQNTQKRITAEQERHDLFLALALELYNKRKTDHDEDGFDTDSEWRISLESNDEEADEDEVESLRNNTDETHVVAEDKIQTAIESSHIEAQELEIQDFNRFETFSPDIGIADEQHIEEWAISCQPAEPEVGESRTSKEAQERTSSEPPPDEIVEPSDVYINDVVHESHDEDKDESKEENPNQSTEENTQSSRSKSLIVKLITHGKYEPCQPGPSETMPSPSHSSERHQKSRRPKPTIRFNLRNSKRREKKSSDTKQRSEPSKPERKPRKKKARKRKAADAFDNDSDGEWCPRGA